jgi:hypothetical protein
MLNSHLRAGSVLAVRVREPFHQTTNE